MVSVIDVIPGGSSAAELLVKFDENLQQMLESDRTKLGLAVGPFSYLSIRLLAGHTQKWYHCLGLDND